MNDFKLFQAEFKRWQVLFGLTGYKVYFKYEPIEKSFADIYISQGDMVATVRLTSKLPDKDKPHKDIKQLHLFVKESDEAKTNKTATYHHFTKGRPFTIKV